MGATLCCCSGHCSTVIYLLHKHAYCSVYTKALPLKSQACMPLLQYYILRVAPVADGGLNGCCSGVQVPVELTDSQAECYRTLLARFFEVLADPKPPRHGGHRASQLKHVCNELRKVSDDKQVHVQVQLFKRSRCNGQPGLVLRVCNELRKVHNQQWGAVMTEASWTQRTLACAVPW